MSVLQLPELDFQGKAVVVKGVGANRKCKGMRIRGFLEMISPPDARSNNQGVKS